MEIKLEQDEVLTLLSEALGHPISPEDVIIKAKPFSITIKNVKKDIQLPSKTSKAKKTPPLEGTPAEEIPTTMSLAALLSTSALIERTGGDCPTVARPLGIGEEDAPPPFSPTEIGGKKK